MLVGGTALALRLGHRRSVDLDFFTGKTFEAADLAEQLKQEFQAREVRVSRNSVSALIDGVKIDCIAHRYPQLAPSEQTEGLRLASFPDLAAMKCNAVVNRGVKKDFWDVHALLEHYSVGELLDFTVQKYAGDSRWNLEKSLLYFDDAERDPDPMDLRGVSWEEVKSDLISAVRSK